MASTITNAKANRLKTSVDNDALNVIKILRDSHVKSLGLYNNAEEMYEQMRDEMRDLTKISDEIDARFDIVYKAMIKSYAAQRDLNSVLGQFEERLRIEGLEAERKKVATQ